MGPEVPSLELWPKLRRRIKDCKTRKAKSKFHSYASQGLEKFSLVVAELQARRDSVVERIGTPGSMVRSMSRSRRQEVDSVSPSQVAESVAADEFFDSKSDTEVDSVRGERESVESSVAFEESVQGVEMVLQREVFGFGGLDMRGRKGVRARRKSLCGRERRWRQANATFVVILGIMAEKSANVAGSILAALLLGVASPCRRGKQHLCRLLTDIVKHLQEHLLQGLTPKRLDEEPPLISSPGNQETILNPPSISSPASYGQSPLPRNHEACLESPVIRSAVSKGLSPLSINREASPESPVIRSSGQSPLLRNREASLGSPVHCHSSPGHIERCSSPTSNKLNQLKTKVLKSFSQTKSAREFRALRASSMPPVSTSCEDAENPLGSHSEWRSPLAAEENILPVPSTSPPDRMMKKKSFLQRRSTLYDQPGASENNIRCNSFSRSRFGSLRISVSHQDDFGTRSPRCLRIGSLRISTSMKDSPSRSVELLKRPCSPASTEGLRIAPQERSPFPEREMKRRHKLEAFLAVIFLVALLFLIVGRSAAVLATSVCLMFLSQLDKFQQSNGGAGWDTDVSRRTMSISRKLRTSEPSFLSPRGFASPRTPASTTPTSMANECRRSICMGQFFGRSKQP